MERDQRVINSAEVRKLVADGYTSWRELVRVAIRAYERIFMPRFYLRDLNASRHISQEESDAQVERVWNEFWMPIFRDAGWEPDHSLDLNFVKLLRQVKLELYDMHNLMSMVSEAYYELSGGRVSKPLTDPSVVVAFAEENFREWAIRDAIDHIEFLRASMLEELIDDVDYPVIESQVSSWDQVIKSLREAFLNETVDSDAEEVEHGPS